LTRVQGFGCIQTKRPIKLRPLLCQLLPLRPIFHAGDTLLGISTIDRAIHGALVLETGDGELVLPLDASDIPTGLVVHASRLQRRVGGKLCPTLGRIVALLLQRLALGHVLGHGIGAGCFRCGLRTKVFIFFPQQFIKL